MKNPLIYIILLLFVSHAAFAQSLTGESVEKTGTTTSNSFVTLNDGADAALTIDVSSVNKVMVIATFNCKNSGSSIGSFRTADNADNSINSGTIQRSLNTYFGVGSVVHIFDVSSFSGNRTYVFQHATTAGTSTTAVQLTAIALYDGSNQFASQVESISAPVALTSSWTSVVETDVVISPGVGGFYVAASIQSGKDSGTENTVGEWVIQYKKTTTGSWTDLSYTINRSTSGTGKGIINLVGALPDNTVAGDYYFRVAHQRSSGTDPVETQFCNLVAVSLSTGSGFLPVSVSSKPSIKTTSTNMSSAIETILQPQADTKLFLHAQYGMQANRTADAPKYDLYVKEEDVEFYDGSDFERYLSSKTDQGSAGSSGLVAGLINGSNYTISLRHASVKKVSLTTVSSYLIGFGLNVAESFKVPITVNASQGLVSSSYSTLKAAFDDINSGIFRENIEILINDNTIETATCVLNSSGTGAASYTSIHLYPTALGLSIEGNLDDELIYLDGADNLIIDGRVNLIGTSPNLIITNTSTGNSARTIFLKNDATYNTFRYCIIKGAQRNLYRGVFQFSTSTAKGTSLGNSNNTIEYNKFTYAGANASSAPATMIYSSGTNGKPNSNNSIDYNEFVDYQRNASSSYGIFISSNSGEYNISNNSFYHTATFIPTGDYTYRVIYINNKSAGNFNINGNYIGGTEKECAGTSWIKTGKNTIFEGIYLKTNKTIVSNVYNNTIKNINWTNSGNANWRAIQIIEGAVNIGTLGGNTIGAEAGVESIVVTNSSSGGYMYGIRVQSKNAIDVSNNVIGSLKSKTTNSAHSFHLIGIGRTNANGDITISNNTIGSSITSNSLHAASASTSNSQYIVGIKSEGTENTIISGNTVANITNSVTGTNNSSTNGIETSGGSNTITDNIVSEISSASAQTGGYSSVAAIGIAQKSTVSGVAQIVRGNTVRNIRSTHTSAAINMHGIYYMASSSGNQEISENFIQGFSFESSDVGSEFNGIFLYNCQTVCANNIITLGDESLGYNIIGIWDNGGSGYDNNLYFNTVYIGGSVSAGSSNKTAALWSASNSSTRDYRNNIFQNARTGGTLNSNFAIYIRGTASITIDYNDYLFPTESILGEISSIAYSDSAAWQTGTGQDVHSLSTDPGFTSPGGILSTDYKTAVILSGVTGTGVSIDYDEITRPAIPQMGAFEMNDYVWLGTTNTDFATTTNWKNDLVPSNGADVTFAADPVNHCYLDQARTIRNIINAQNTDQFVLNGQELTLTGSLTLSNGAEVNASAASSVLIMAGTEAQNIPAGALVGDVIAGLTVNNLEGLTLNESITISENLILTEGELKIDANTLTLNGPVSVTNGTLTGSTSSNIVFGGSGAATNLPAVTLNNLSINRANGINLAGAVNVGGTLALTSGILTIGANNLTFWGVSPTRISGAIDASNSNSNLTFTNSTAITLPPLVFTAAINNLTINGEGGVTASSDLTINGLLLLQGENPSYDKGSLDMGTNTLSMEADATTIGNGDVTGIVSRTTFIAGTNYTFGNEFTTISFESGGTLPSKIQCKIAIGEVPSWKPDDAIQRVYDFVQTGGISCFATVTMHYKEDELNGIFERELTPFTYAPTPTEWGRSNYDLTDNWIEISHVSIAEFPTTFGELEATLGLWSGTNTYTWNGQSSTDWNTGSNWTPVAVPSASSYVVITDAINTPNDAILPTSTEIVSLTILPGGILNGGTATELTINGANGAWSNEGTLNPGTSDVIFTNASPTISGATDFYDLTINDGVELSLHSNSVVRIAGAITKTGTANIHTVLDGNTTIEYNGGNQTVIIPNSSTNRYSTLILSGTGVKTMPTQALDIVGSFIVSGSTSTSAASSLTISEDLFIDEGATFNTGAYDHILAGNFENYGTFNATSSQSLTLSGSSSQNILGEATTNFTNLVIDNSEGVILYLNGNVNETLTLTDGILIVNEAILGINGTISKTGGQISISDVSTLSFGGSGALTLNTDLFIEAPSVKALIINNAAGISFGNQSITVTDSLALDAGTLNVLANTFTMSGSKITRTTGNISAGGASDSIIFNNTQAILLPASTFTGTINDLTLTGLGGVTSAGDFTVNGILNLQADNPSDTTGILNMMDGTTLKILTMGASATTIGTSDVTGIVKRSSFSADTPYSFGNQFTTMNFASGETLPTDISVKIVIGQAPDWKTDAILREYDIVKNGGTGTVSLQLHYLETELNEIVENTLSLWKYISPTASDLGKTTVNTEDNYIQLTGIDITTLPTSYDACLWTLAHLAITDENLAAASVEKNSTSSSTAFVTVTDASLALNVASTSKVMVIATFACKTTSGTATGSYRIAQSGSETTINSGNIERSLNVYSGVGSVVYIFDDAGDKTFVFQHKTSDAGVAINTSVQLTAIALNDGTNELANDVKSLNSALTLTSNWATVLETGAVTLPNAGGFYVAASVQSAKTSGTETTVGEWVLQYKKSSSGAWTDLNDPANRSTSGSGKGVINLVAALPDNTAPDDYWFRVAHRLLSGTDPVETQACKLIAVALGVDGEFFPVTIATKPSISTTESVLNAAIERIIIPKASTDLFIHAQYGMQADGVSNAPNYDLNVYNGTTEVFNGSDFPRYLSGSSDRGSAASSGLATGLLINEIYQIYLRHAATSGSILTTTTSYVVGFGLTRADSFTLPINKWKGTTSSDWGSASNWTAGVVPSADPDILFDDAPEKDCILDQNRTINNITNAQSSYKTVTNGFKLTLLGDLQFTNGAQLDASATTSTIQYSGTSTQNIQVDEFLNNTIYNLTVDNEAGVTQNSDIIVSNDLTINSGKLLTVEASKQLTVLGAIANTAGSKGFVLQSNSSGTASLIHNTDDVPATVQRYVSGDAEDWHFLSSPVSGQSISGEWLPSGTYGNGTGYDMYLWNEPTNCWIYKLDANWNTLNSGDDFAVGRGYLYSVQESNPTKQFAGNLNSGTVTYELTIDGSADATLQGFNLVGNPYPSSIDWRANSEWDRSKLISSGGGNDMWIWNPDAGNYGVYNSADASGVGTNAVTQFIAPMQGFFVRAESAGNMVSTNDVRLHDATTLWKSGQITPSRITAVVYSESDQTYDEVRLLFGYPENKVGAAKLFSPLVTAPSLYLPVGDANFTIRYLSDTVSNPKVNLLFKAGRDGDYTIDFNFNMGDFETVILEDKQTKDFIDLTIASDYRFRASKSDNENRFVLHFSEIQAEANLELPAKIYSSSGNVVLDLTRVDEITEVKIVDVLGRTILQKSVSGNVIHRLPLNTSSQVFIVYAKTRNAFIVKKVFAH